MPLRSWRAGASRLNTGADNGPCDLRQCPQGQAIRSPAPAIYRCGNSRHVLDDCLGDLLTHRPHGVERIHRALKYDRNFLPADFVQFLFTERGQVSAIEENPATHDLSCRGQAIAAEPASGWSCRSRSPPPSPINSPLFKVKLIFSTARAGGLAFVDIIDG